MKSHLLIFLSFISASAIAQNNSTIHIKGNPIIPDLIADPSIVEIDGTFYCYATTDGYNQGLSTSGPPVVWESKDFVNWSFQGIFFPSAAGQLYWAPSTVTKANGKYYLYPTINTNIQVAVADSPDGPFRAANSADNFKGTDAAQPLVKMKGPRGTKGIDAEVFIDDDGQAYMFWAQRGAARLKADMITLDTTIVVIPTKRKGYSEGPFIFKRKGIYYYMYTLSGNENYQYAYMYSKVSPLGPFEAPEKDIISTTDHQKCIYGPGHGCVFSTTGTDNYYFAYLEFGIGGTNRQVWVDKLEFNEDGTIKPVVLTLEGVGALRPIEKQMKNLALGAKAFASSIKSELKVKPIKDTSLRKTETYIPENAIDGCNGTRWMALETDSLAWYTVDLGTTRKVKRSETYFVKPTAGHAYRLEYSTDNKSWKLCGGHTDIKIQSPHVDELSVKARYLRITFIRGLAGIWEVRVY